MMKKIFLSCFIIALNTILFYSCKSDSTTSPNNVPSFKGAYVFYESCSAGGSDYGFFDAGKDTVYNNLFQNANNGTALDYHPGGFKILDNKNLLVTCGGQVNQNGRIYTINTDNSQVTKSVGFGNGVGDYTFGNGKIYVGNRNVAYVTEFDMNLNIINNYIDVGPNPSRPIYTSGRYIFCKLPETAENSLAIINGANNQVEKVTFSFSPVCLINNYYGYFLSGYKTKKIFVLDSTSLMPVDSFAIPTSDTAVNDMIKVGETTMLVVAGGHEVWKVSFLTNPPTVSLLIPSQGGTYAITAIAYEDLNKRIYIGDNNGGPPALGKLWVFDATNGSFIKYYDLFGRNPAGFAFKY